ncbi:MAG TPA: pyrroline-5-carboxylate reductase [Candidatus Paceibacterota bacterium]
MEKDKLENKVIAILGGGHMGCALAEGLARGKKILPSRIWVADPTLSKIAYLKKYGIKVTMDNSLAVRSANVIFLAVKPVVIKEVMAEVGVLTKNRLLISVASVPTIKRLKSTAGKNQKIVRIMPNLPVKYNQGVIGFFGGNIGKTERAVILDILSSLGVVVPLQKEKDIDTIDVISACGPAITSTFIEMMVGYAKSKGMNKEIALKVIMQVFAGTIYHLKSSDMSPNEFIQSVATKGGITEAILKNLDENFKKIFIQAMEKGHIKTKKLNNSW